MQQAQTNAILERIAERLGIAADDLQVVPDPLPGDASPRMIAKHLHEQKLLRAGAWRLACGDAWRSVESAAHLRAVIETLIDRDISRDDAEHIGAHLDILDQDAGQLYDEMLSIALQDRLRWDEADQWARRMTARKLPR